MTIWMVVAALAVGAAVLLVTAGPHVRPAAPRRTAVAAGTAVATLGLMTVGLRPLVPVVVVAVAATGAWLLRRRSVRFREAVEVGEKVRECCDALAAELSVGVAPGQALLVAEQIWPPWQQVGTAHRIGGSVPEAMVELAETRAGAADLAQVAAAWELSQHSGSALAASLGAVAEELADKQATRALVRTELSSARSTARLVVALPVLTLLVGSSNGDPLGWLVGSTGGLLCLAGGLALALAGLGWIERIAASVEKES